MDTIVLALTLTLWLLLVSVQKQRAFRYTTTIKDIFGNWVWHKKHGPATEGVIAHELLGPLRRQLKNDA